MKRFQLTATFMLAVIAIAASIPLAFGVTRKPLLLPPVSSSPLPSW